MKQKEYHKVIHRLAVAAYKASIHVPFVSAEMRYTPTPADLEASGAYRVARATYAELTLIDEQRSKGESI